MPEIRTISEIIEEISPYYREKKRKGKGGPETEHNLIYDSGAEALEPIYFFILDLMNDLGLAPEKLVDNFVSTPGSTHFTETGLKAGRIQDEASKLLASAGVVLKSVLNIVYDLKEFKTRLQQYDDLKPGKKEIKEAAVLSLKQIWMDKVDIAKGNSSIKAMALGQAGYQTLIDAFLVAKTPEDVDKLDLNDRVRRILKPRVHEFNVWLEQSEKELRKRYEIEKTYLRQQLNNLKLYSRWAKPYLRAAQKLEMKEAGREASIVNLFNTVRMELTLLGKSKLDVEKLALAGNLPREFKKIRLKRDYYSCVLVEFKFTAIPQQAGRFTGKSEVTFKAYALNQDELDKLDYELDKSDVGDVLNLIEGATTESLEQLQQDIDEFLEEKTSEEKAKESSRDESNPFLALIGAYNKKETSKKEEGPGKQGKKDVIIRKDDFIEKEHLRKVAAEIATDTCFSLFDVYKKAHGMPSYT